MKGNKPALGSDLKKLDSHQTSPDEYEEVPELGDDWFAAADVKVAGRVVNKGGRPKSARPKRQVTLRLDADIVDKAKADGPGWQSRINAALRGAFKLAR